MNLSLPDLLPSTVGAMAELCVAADLLRHGFEVFRAVSPHSTCDLAVLKGGKLYRVEVKAGYRTASGVLKGNAAKNPHDILAIYHAGEGIVAYTPELQSLSN